MKWKMNRKKVREIVAYHEAAHAVVARVLGVEVTFIAMFPTDDSGAAGAQTVSAAHLARNAPLGDQLKAIEIDIMVAMAGAQSQERHRPGLPRGGEAEDTANIFNSAMHHRYHTTGKDLPREGEKVEIEVSDEDQAYVQALIDRLWNETAALVEKHWDAIRRVAEVLMVQDLLGQSDLDALINPEAARRIDLLSAESLERELKGRKVTP